MTPLLTSHRFRLLGTLVGNGLGQAATAVGAALIVERAFRQLGQPGSLLDVAIVAIPLLAIAAAIAGLRGRERVDAERLGQSYCHDLRIDLVGRLTAMSPRSIGQRSTGSTALRFVGDLTAIRNWVSLGLARLCVAGTMVTGSLVALALIDPLLALAVGAACVVGGIGAIAQGPAVRDATRTARRRRSKLAGRVNETINAAGSIQANNAVHRERNRIRRDSERLRDAMIQRAHRLGRLHAISEATTSIATAGLLGVALFAGMAPAEVAAAMTVVGLLLPQVRALARVQEYRQLRNVADDAIKRFVNRPTLLTEPEHPIPLASGRGELTLADASVGVVQSVSVHLPAGRTVAVVGPNGAGKSTLIAAIARLVDLEGGSVQLDGTNLAEVALPEVHGAIAISGPDLPLMRGSLRRNLTYRNANATPDEIAHVTRLCDLDSFIGSLPDGLDHRITEGGTNLSSGQRQRLMLARAIITRPRLLILDEADANLDAATASIVDRIVEAHEGSCIIVTHRAERLSSADFVWHLERGKLVEQGPTAELLGRQGNTAQLFHGAQVA